MFDFRGDWLGNTDADVTNSIRQPPIFRGNMIV